MYPPTGKAPVPRAAAAALMFLFIGPGPLPGGTIAPGCPCIGPAAEDGAPPKPAIWPPDCMVCWSMVPPIPPGNIPCCCICICCCIGIAMLPP